VNSPAVEAKPAESTSPAAPTVFSSSKSMILAPAVHDFSSGAAAPQAKPYGSASPPNPYSTEPPAPTAPTPPPAQPTPLTKEQRSLILMAGSKSFVVIPPGAADPEPPVIVPRGAPNPEPPVPPPPSKPVR
jgi:hypothetical protein